MNPEEYRKLEQVEREHWFYAGKREIVRYWINRSIDLRPDSLLMDCGAGTGAFVAEMQNVCRVLAVDDHEDSLQILRHRLPPESVREGSCLSLPAGDASVDCLTALDVLEHVEEDRAAVGEICRVLKPGGIAIITVPALMALWSDWDVVLHHFRRYDRRGLRQLLALSGLQLEHCNYINVVAFLPIYLIRKFRRQDRTKAARMEDAVPPRWLNRFLGFTFTRLACQRAIRFPAGVGLLAVLRRT